MRSALAIIGLSVAVLCTSMASQQADPPAEQKFKNIVSFKGQKASAVVPSMEFMSASLKVGCDYCHVADRSSDEKRSKQTAREMIAMQKDINDKNFGGRTQVTCATCHAGHTHPVAVPPMTGLDIRARRSNDVSAAPVLAAYAKALSADGSAPVGVKLTGNVTAFGKTQPFEATYSAGKFFFLTHASQGDQKQGFDGSTVWFTTPGGIQKVPLEFGLRYSRQSALFLSASDLPKEDAPTGGTATIDGKEMVVLSGALPDGSSRGSYYFDKQSGLLARAVFIYPTILGNIEQINDYSGYQKVGSTQVPMKIVSHTPEGDTTIEFSAGTPLPSAEAGVFAPPQ